MGQERRPGPAATGHPLPGVLFTLASPPPRGVIAGTASLVGVTCGARMWPLEPAVRAGPTNGGPSCLGDSFWNIIVQEGHKLSCSRLCPSTIHFLALGKKIKNLSLRVWMCAREAVFLRTRLQMRSCGAIFRHPFSQQCCLKIQLRLLIGIFITILSAAPA